MFKRKEKINFKKIKKYLNKSHNLFSLVVIIIATFTSIFLAWQNSSGKMIAEPDKSFIEEIFSTKSSLSLKAPNNNLPRSLDKQKAVSIWHSFGDHFSSNAYIDNNKTNMFFDEQVTALVFPPIYDFKKLADCADKTCDLADLIFTDQSKIKKPNRTPSELIGKKIISSRLDRLSSKQVASYVVLDGEQERAYVYFLDGSEFSPIITSETESKMITQYGRGGGVVTVGGSDDDFLIIYIGYESFGFHYLAGELSSISHFFGLRVTDGGFNPYIIKQGEGKRSLWYILSLNSDKPKLIKLWQNGGNNIVGAYDFSYIFRGLGSNLSAFKSGAGRGEIEFILKSSTDSFSFSKFSDQGFDNSQDRVAASININTEDHKITKARIKSIGITGDAEIFLADSDSNFIKVREEQEIKFSGDNSTLFWQINFSKSNDLEYSPWLDHINYLDYYLAE